MISDRASYYNEALSRKDPWPPAEVSLEVKEDQGELVYSIWLNSAVDFDVSGLEEGDSRWGRDLD